MECFKVSLKCFCTSDHYFSCFDHAFLIYVYKDLSWARQKSLQLFILSCNTGYQTYCSVCAKRHHRATFRLHLSECTKVKGYHIFHDLLVWKALGELIIKMKKFFFDEYLFTGFLRGWPIKQIGQPHHVGTILFLNP